MRRYLHMMVFALALAGALSAQRGRVGPLRRPPPAAMTAVDLWNAMTPEERERALRRLPPERRRRIREQIARFNSLPAMEQRRLRERYRRLNALPPERQETVRQQLRRLRELPPERRRTLAREARLLRALPEPERAARIEGEEFRTAYSPEERRILQDLAGILARE
jgi:hypothetical protein